MKAMAAGVLLILSVAAGAKPAPLSDLKSLDDQATRLARSDAGINIDPARDSRASREHEYFQAPHTNFKSGSFTCRARSIVFDKTRLVQSCD